MPLLDEPTLAGLFRCPRCRAPLTEDGLACADATCELATSGFDCVAGQPVLVDFRDSIFERGSIQPASDLPERTIQKLLHALQPRNETARVIAARLSRDLRTLVTNRRPRLLIIGGGTIGRGLEQLYADPAIDLIAFDVFPSRYTQFVADGHRLPLADGCVDAVIVQAVLEHVLEPSRVVAEIHRVLCSDGLVYADTPFLQHVHEGAYDFTRFTESGHRWLFRDFALIDSGVVAGTGTQLAWTISHTVRSLVPLKGVSSAVRLAMTPLARLIDRLAPAAHAVDGASSVYFYGRRATEAIEPRAMVEHYRGAQRAPKRLV